MHEYEYEYDHEESECDEYQHHGDYEEEFECQEVHEVSRSGRSGSVASSAPLSIPQTVLNVASPSVDKCEEGDCSPTALITYRINWIGLPAALAAIGVYGSLLFHRMNTAVFDQKADDLLPLTVALRMRYFGAVVYFLSALLYRPYIFEMRNAEAPLIVSTILQLHYTLHCDKDSMSDAPVMAVPVVMVAVMCCLRRWPCFRMILNPWTKDKTELVNLVRRAQAAAHRARRTFLN